MPCGKKSQKKIWDHPRDLRVVKPSKFQKNAPSVKKHWRNVVRELELSYKDEKFWETSADIVSELVGPIIFKKIRKIFDIPEKPIDYQPRSETSSLTPSAKCYYQSTTIRLSAEPHVHMTNKSRLDRISNFSDSSFKSNVTSQMIDEDDYVFDDDQQSTTISQKESSRTPIDYLSKEKQSALSKMFVKSSYSIRSIKSSKFSKIHMSALTRSQMISNRSCEDLATSLDDLEVHCGGVQKKTKHCKNPFYEMLYCCESEADMIKWNSKYKKKEFEVSASDEFSKRAEIKTKQIAKDFFDWWSHEGSAEYKGEIKRPDDIEDLFQIWFDEHASRGMTMNPKIIPCVLPGIAKHAGAPKASCPNALDRHVDWDVLAEKTPAFKTAFGKSLPKKLVHLPPDNKTEKQWRGLVIPEDLRSMSCVWDDIMHLTSTKSFKAYLKANPTLKIPPCLADDGGVALKKQPFIIPSDFVVRDRRQSISTHDLALPVSELTIELKDVLDKLMNQ